MTANQQLLANLKCAASDTVTRDKAHQNFLTTFKRLGMGSKADFLSGVLFEIIARAETMEQAEQSALHHFGITTNSGGHSVLDKIDVGLANRFKLLFKQVSPHLKDVQEMIDYGCGAGVLTQMLHDKLDMAIDGVDVRDFRAENVTVPVRHFDGYRVPVADKHYQAAVLTNVIHHEAENARLLQELTRIATRKLVIIETVPEGESDEEAKSDWGRMILNDALWNRFFNRANIPCPGTYETPRGWIRRFTDLGWHCTHTEDLGFDQPTIQDRHHLLVFER